MGGKLNAARKALEFVKDGMVVGLGSGSTSEIFIKLLGRKVGGEKLKIVCVPTSVRSEKVARKAGLVVRGFKEVERADLAVDGADQVDAGRNLIKGYGGALLREKLVDCAAKRFIVIVDESKLTECLGGWVPLEVQPSEAEGIVRGFGAMHLKARVRMKRGKKFVTDNGNSIVDVYFEVIVNPGRLDELLRGVPGVIETGLFIGDMWRVIVGSESGVRLLG